MLVSGTYRCSEYIMCYILLMHILVFQGYDSIPREISDPKAKEVSTINKAAYLTSVWPF